MPRPQPAWHGRCRAECPAAQLPIITASWGWHSLCRPQSWAGRAVRTVCTSLSRRSSQVLDCGTSYVLVASGLVWSSQAHRSGQAVRAAICFRCLCRWRRTMDTLIKRRRLLATLCAVLVAVAVGGYGGPSVASVGMQAAGKPYTGTTLRILLANHPWAVAIKPLLPSFEKATGMSVKIESYGEDQLAQKLTVEFTSGSSDIDAFMQRPLQQAKLFARNGWTQDLNAFVKDPRKTPASYDFRDFDRPALATESVNGQLTGIPIVVEHEVLYYRKDLLQATHLSVP